jgi:hypothetical protein
MFLVHAGFDLFLYLIFEYVKHLEPQLDSGQRTDVGRIPVPQRLGGDLYRFCVGRTEDHDKILSSEFFREPFDQALIFWVHRAGRRSNEALCSHLDHDGSCRPGHGGDHLPGDAVAFPEGHHFLALEIHPVVTSSLQMFRHGETLRWRSAEEAFNGRLDMINRRMLTRHPLNLDAVPEGHVCRKACDPQIAA